MDPLLPPAAPSDPPAGGVAVEPVHDFVRKLRQRDLFEGVLSYVEWQRARRRARSPGEVAPPPLAQGPFSINLDLTTACNWACSHCIDFDTLNSRVHHDYAALLASLETLAAHGLRSVILIGGGEPTVHPRFVETVSFLKEHQLQVAVVSNGSRPERLAQIAPLLGGEDWIRLSLDAGTEATFQALHRPRQAITLSGICEAVSDLRARFPSLRLGFSFLILWPGAAREDGEDLVPNVGEMALAATLARESGFDYISFKPFLLRTPAGAEVMDPGRARQALGPTLEAIEVGLRAARLVETERFAVVESTNLRLLRSGTWPAWQRQPSTCHMQAFRQVISPLGLWNCPAHRGVKEARIGEAATWTDPDQALKQTEAILDSFDASKACSQVTCLYHAANWWIERAIQDPGVLSGASAAPGGDFFL